MSSHLVNLSSTIECPKCGKNAIVSHHSGEYQCLNCDFEKDLSAKEKETIEGGLGEIVFAIGGALLTAAILL